MFVAESLYATEQFKLVFANLMRNLEDFELNFFRKVHDITVIYYC